MEHLTKLLRDSYDLQESKPNESAYWHLQQLRSEIKQLALTDVSQQRELLIAELKEWDLGYTSFNNLEEKLAEKLLKAINYTHCCTELCDKCNKENHLQKLTDQAQDLGLGYD